MTIFVWLAGPNVRLDVIEGAGHFPWRDKPKAYWMSIERFIETVGG